MGTDQEFMETISQSCLEYQNIIIIDSPEWSKPYLSFDEDKTPIHDEILT
jgi:hypothetical protein